MYVHVHIVIEFKSFLYRPFGPWCILLVCYASKSITVTLDKQFFNGKLNGLDLRFQLGSLIDGDGA